MSDQEKRPNRRGRSVKKKRGEPAEFVPGPAQQPKGFDPAFVLDGLNVWWHKKDNYWRIPTDPDEQAEEWNSSILKQALRVRGVWNSQDKNSHTQIDLCMEEVRNRRVHGVGEVAGWERGIHELEDGRKILVTNSCRLIKPKEGSFSLLEKFLAAVLNGDGEAQTDYLLAWLKVAISALSAGELRPGHLLALVGAVGSGKSFIQEHIITPLLGGRSADPSPYLMEKTIFNEEIVRAEHLMIQELTSGMNAKDRALYGERLKQLLVNESMSLNAKYQNPVMVKPYRRVTISFNDNRTSAFPSLAADFADKLLLLKVGTGAAPMLPDTDEERVTFRRQISAELPAFVYFLEQWEIPARLLRSPNYGRFGFDGWIHPAIESTMFEGEPKAVLLYALDNMPGLYRLDDDGRAANIGPKGGEEWRSLLQAGPEWSRIERYVDFANGVAIRLAELAERFPDRFKKVRTKKHNLWIIDPPEIPPAGIAPGPTPNLL